jgi:hypothetical protein
MLVESFQTSNTAKEENTYPSVIFNFSIVRRIESYTLYQRRGSAQPCRLSTYHKQQVRKSVAKAEVLTANTVPSLHLYGIDLKIQREAVEEEKWWAREALSECKASRLTSKAPRRTPVRRPTYLRRIGFEAWKPNHIIRPTLVCWQVAIDCRALYVWVGRGTCVL